MGPLLDRVAVIAQNFIMSKKATYPLRIHQFCEQTFQV